MINCLANLILLTIIINICPFFGLFQPTNVLAGENRWTVFLKGITSKPITAIQISPKNSQIIYVATYGDGILGTNDNGKSWFFLNNGLKNKEILSLKVDPKIPDNLYVGTSAGFFFSKNRGKLWSDSILDSLKINNLFVCPKNAGIVYAGTNKGIYYINCRAPDIRFEPRGLIKFNVLSVTGGTSLDIAKVIVPEQSSVKSYTYQNIFILFAGTSNGRIFKKRNIDFDWQNITPEEVVTANDTIYSLTVDRQDLQKVYVGTNHGVYKSLNGGFTWCKRLKSSLDDLGIYQLYVNPYAENIIYAATSTCGIFRSKDFAITWHPLNFGLLTPILSFEFCLTENEKLLAGTKNGEIYHFELKNPVKTCFGILNFETDGIPVEAGEKFSNELCLALKNAVRIISLQRTQDGEIYNDNRLLLESNENLASLGVEWLVSGKILNLNNRLYVNIEIRDIKTHQILKDRIDKYTPFNYYPSLINEIANKIKDLNK